MWVNLLGRLSRVPRVLEDRLAPRIMAASEKAAAPLTRRAALARILEAVQAAAGR